jgi:hypothetical protein
LFVAKVLNRLLQGLGAVHTKTVSNRRGYVKLISTIFSIPLESWG